MERPKRLGKERTNEGGVLNVARSSGAIIPGGIGTENTVDIAWRAELKSEINTETYHSISLFELIAEIHLYIVTY